MQAITTNIGTSKPLGYQQILAATLSASTPLTLPSVVGGFPVRMAIIQCNSGTVRWRDDGTAPTSTVGMSLGSGGELDYAGDLTAIRFIVSASFPILDISYYA